MDWEQTKENFAPVRQGRPKEVLSDVHDAADSATKAANLNKRRELERDVREYQGDDPLEPWLRLVKWTQEQLLGGSKLQLQETIETAQKALSALGSKYHSDVRYLRLWIQYADCLSDPADVFCFLRDKQIGHEYALFYEAHATHYELKGNCTAADAVYQEGIARCAKPVERIKQKYVAFQSRMAQRIQRKIQEEGLLGEAGVRGDGGPARMSFSSLRQSQPPVGHSSSRPNHPPALPPQLIGITAAPASGAAATQLPLPGVRSSNLPASALPSIMSMQRPLQPLPVAVDAEFQGQQPPVAGAHLPGFLAVPQVSGMKELKPYSILHKENNDQPGIWTNASLPQNKVLMPGPWSARLEICVDEEFVETAPPAKQQQQQQGCNAVRARLLDRPPPPLGAASAVAAEAPPMGSHSDVHGAMAATAVPAVPNSKPEQQLRKADKDNLGCNSSLLTGSDGREQSFEEARYLAWGLSQQSATNAPTEHAVVAADVVHMQQQPVDLQRLPMAPLRQQQQQQPEQVPGNCASTSSGQVYRPFNAHQPSVPCSSKAAAAPAQTSSMQPTARQPLSESCSSMRASSSSGLGRVVPVAGSQPEANACISGKDLERTNRAAGLLPHTAQLSLDPTVTITTKAAFDILNGMFSDNLVHGGTAAVADCQRPYPDAHAPAPAAGADPAAGLYGCSTSGFRDMTGPPDSWTQPPEPTVTISTRAAYNMLNDMFCDQLPHEEHLRQHKAFGTLGRVASKPISTSDVCRLANLGKGTAGAGAKSSAALMPSTASAFIMHEDTEFGIPGLLGRHNAAPSSMIYEDTELLGGPSHQSSAMHKAMQHQLSDPMMGMGILSNPVGNAVLVLHEDTEFMTRDIQST